MTREQRIGLSVVMAKLNVEIGILERAPSRVAEAIAVVSSPIMDIAVKAGTYQAVVEHSAPELRALHQRLCELFPKIVIV